MLIDNDGQFLKFPLSHFIYHVEVKDGGTLLHHNLATSNFPFFYYTRLLRQAGTTLYLDINPVFREFTWWLNG